MDVNVLPSVNKGSLLSVIEKAKFAIGVCSVQNKEAAG